LICLSLSISPGMLLRLQWPCRRVHHNAKSLASITARSFASSTPYRNDLATSKTRNIGIIAHIDAVCRNTYFLKM
jgi:elongation factor G